MIPKKKSPKTINDFHPISLCSVVYKIIAKVLANRLKGILSEIINESQSAFVQRRMIFNNIMIAHETIHSMKNKCNGQVGWLVAKLDMSKAYDKVKWNYLEGLMSKMGFASRWVQLIMSCMRSIRKKLTMVNESLRFCIIQEDQDYHFFQLAYS